MWEDPLPGFSAKCSKERLDRKKNVDPLDLEVSHIARLAGKIHENRERERSAAAKKRKELRKRTKLKLQKLLQRGKELQEMLEQNAAKKQKEKAAKIGSVKANHKKTYRNKTVERGVKLRSSQSAENSATRLASTASIHTCEFLIADYDFAGLQEGDLGFLKGEVIKVLERPKDAGGWWVGRSLISEEEGQVPSNFFRPYDISSQIVDASDLLGNDSIPQTVSEMDATSGSALGSGRGTASKVSLNSV